MDVTLKELINKLESLPRGAIIRHGFGAPHSDRGSYFNVAFTPEKDVTVESMLEHAKSAVGATFTGYKGGEFTMDEDTYCFIGEYGCCGDEISDILFEYWMDDIFGEDR